MQRSDDLLGRAGDPWWHEVVLLNIGLTTDPTQLLAQLKNQSVVLAAEALADAHDPGTPTFRELANEIVRKLIHTAETQPENLQEAVDATAPIERWDATDWRRIRDDLLGTPI